VERAGDHDAMEAGELIAGKIVVGDLTLQMEIFAVVTSVEGVRTGTTNRSPPAEATSPPTQSLCQGNLGLSLDQTGVRANQVSARM
jgi:hypothetical protein